MAALYLLALGLVQPRVSCWGLFLALMLVLPAVCWGCVQGNVRGLLGSLQTVLWEDSGWKPIGMGDLLEPAQVTDCWRGGGMLLCGLHTW
jgi:hypothetical protein